MFDDIAYGLHALWCLFLLIVIFLLFCIFGGWEGAVVFAMFLGALWLIEESPGDGWGKTNLPKGGNWRRPFGWKREHGDE